MNEQKPPLIAICAIFRNEAPYLREWIEFHRLVGVARFFLYQNRSTDEWPSILQPYVEQGVVEVTDWPLPRPCQLEAYQHFIARYKGQHWQVAFIDCDEFLFSPGGATLGDALSTLPLADWGAFGAHWMCFGASAHERAADSLVTERFTLRPADSFPPNRHIKSIVRMDRIESTGADPHHFMVSGGTWNESGVEVIGPLASRPAHSLLRINHYHTKSREEYLDRIVNGRADSTAPKSQQAFDDYQADEIDDRAIWRFLPALRARLTPPPAVTSGGDKDEAAGQHSVYRYFEPTRARTGKELPRDLSGFTGYHEGETFLVCGCGSSLSQITAPERFLTIGVNDTGRLFHPDYLVVVNPPGQFTGDRFRYVENTRASAVFSQLNLGISHPNLVRFRLGKRGGCDLSDPDSLPYTRNSPYIALCLAIKMGARRIGLIGVDFTDHHFFASTGQHPLTSELTQINNEYAALADVCRERGVEVFNLSADSRLTTFPKIRPEEFARLSLVPESVRGALSGSRIFFVNYCFLSCGEVFSDGLRHAAEDLGISSDSAYWDDSSLPARIRSFSPDLLFVVHGRKYSQRWQASLHAGVRSALWLLDEPYEVDDTARFSTLFDITFANDPSTLHRHRNAHFLPVCYDPATYHYRPGTPRRYQAGFIGGNNPAREQMLGNLARRGYLSYAVGGPWTDANVQRVCVGGNIPALETADFYRQTQIVINVFRTRHHFNREQTPAVSMNPRIYEALACGALVVSEHRTEMDRLCPEIPTFETPDQLSSLVQELLGDPERYERLRKAAIRRLAGHTYAHRLYTAASLALGRQHDWNTAVHPICVIPKPRMESTRPSPETSTTGIMEFVPGWDAGPGVSRIENEVIVLENHNRPAPGSELGLLSRKSYVSVRLSFEIMAESGATFVAKVHQLEQRNQQSNSYHLMGAETKSYVARHGHIFAETRTRSGIWDAVSMTWRDGVLTVIVNGRRICRVEDSLMTSGYCFLGVKSGRVRVRNLELTDSTDKEPDAGVTAAGPPRRIVYDSGAHLEIHSETTVSIITTVYDRIACLDACVRSVQALNFDSFEHIIVADAPSPDVVEQLKATIEKYHDRRHRLLFAVLDSRANDWGITPATAGLASARGKYVSFLSDDNGYKPEHFNRLIAALDKDPGLGFAYSGCLYGRRRNLNTAPPAFGQIDLGQPLFRRELFDQYFRDGLPFREFAWDWKMIQQLLQHGVRWQHVNEMTFIFRLAEYPELIPPRTAHSDIAGVSDHIAGMPESQTDFREAMARQEA